MKMTFVLCGAAILQILATYADRAAAAYNANACDAHSPGYASCTGRGTSNPADALGNVLNGDASYTFIQAASAPNITLIYETEYNWQAGVNADLLLLGAVGFVIRYQSQLYFVSLVGCPVLVPISNANTVIDGFTYLTQAYVYAAVSLFDMSYNLGCNVILASRILRIPAQELSVGSYLKLKYSGLRTFLAVQQGSSSLKSMAQNNIVKVDVNVTEQKTGTKDQISVQQNGLIKSYYCDTIREGNESGLDSIMKSMVSVGDKVCNIVIKLGQLVSQVSEYLLDVIKVVTGLKTGSTFALSVGYTASGFIVEDFMDAIFQACKGAAST